jgi:hypothetical protein
MIDAFCTVLALIVPAVLILWAITRKPDTKPESIHLIATERSPSGSHRIAED